jgi:pilus assembly protein FimV
MKTRLKASLIAAAIAALPLGAQAAGMGRLNVMSGLGQPLRAEVEVSASPQELNSLVATLAAPDAFKQANIAYASVMTALRIGVEKRGAKTFVTINSSVPVNDPFVDMLIELNWSGGRLVREYTFLLDPPIQVGPKALAETVPPVTRPQPAARPVARPAPSQAPAASGGSVASSAADDTYQVKRGDTLRKIAGETSPAGVSLDQMLVALLRGNPDAFFDNNMNRLRAGKILKIPSAATATAVSPGDARQEVLAQAQDFNAYRQRLAGAAAAPAAAEAEAGQASGGKITPKLAEPDLATGKAQDQVKVSKTEVPPGADASTRLQALEEDLIARDKALEEANSRVADLERNIQELQKLIEVKSGDMAKLQEQAPAAAEAPPAPPPAAVEPPAPAAAEPPPVAATEPPAETKPEPAKPEPMPVAEVEEEGLLQSMLANPALLFGGGGAIVLLLLLAAYRMRKGREGAAESQLGGPASEMPAEASSVFGASGGQSVDTGNSSVLHTDFSQSGLSNIDTDEGVDPVAEADVYMAYGRDAQAEEILIDAIKADPSRAAVHLKLLEIYAQRESVKQFETAASDFYTQTAGQGPDWEKAAALGRKLDPDNPLYATGDGAAAGAAVAAAATAAEAGADTSTPAEEVPQEMTETWSRPGEIGRFASGEDADAGEADEAVPEVAAAAEDVALDFNLDLDEPAGGGEADVAHENLESTMILSDLNAAEAEEAAEPALEFDLDMGAEPDSGESDEMAATLVDADALRMHMGDGPDIQLDSTNLDFQAPEGGDDGADVDLSETRISPQAPEQGNGAGVVDLEKSAFDGDLLDFDFELGEGEKPADKIATPEIDLSSIDLELGATTLEPVATGGNGAAAPAEAGAGGEEVDTKLELARAYEEMGDQEGARELLEEVLKEGDVAQQDAARTVLAKLG